MYVTEERDEEDVESVQQVGRWLNILRGKSLTQETLSGIAINKLNLSKDE